MMVFKYFLRAGLVFLILPLQVFASNPDISRAVWVNEAIVAIHTYNYKNFLKRQREIASYFTTDGWINYSKVFNASGLPATVKKNAYFVSAVATMPPEITSLGANRWEAVMPILVLYQNPQYRQKQSLKVSIRFKTVPAGQGRRGLAITSLQSKVITPPCVCPPDRPDEENEVAS